MASRFMAVWNSGKSRDSACKPGSNETEKVRRLIQNNKLSKTTKSISMCIRINYTPCCVQCAVGKHF